LSAVQLRPLRIACALTTSAAVTVAVLDDGGFDPGPRLLFAALALAALVLAAVSSWAAVRRAARQPAVIVLLLLAAVGALSTLWTIGNTGDALRWGLVTAGYAAVAICAASLVGSERDATIVAILIGGLAVVCSVVGIIATIRHVGPYAEYSGGYWRPAGTFEYSPALGLLVVSALPVLLRGMCSANWRATALAAPGAAICTVALALTHSRTDEAFAICVCAIAIGAPPRTVRASRITALAAVGVLALVAAAAYAVAGAQVGSMARPAPADGLLVAATVVVASAVWMAVSHTRTRLPPRGSDRARSVLITGVILVVIAVTAAFASGGSGTGSIPHPGSGGFSHGRLHVWSAAIHVAEQRPLYGFGADSFLTATLARQARFQAPVRYAHSLPLEAAVELGIVGFVLVLALYAASVHALLQRRNTPQVWLLGPAVAAFLIANLIDWSWHLAGSGAIWAVAVGGILAVARGAHAA
jgi:O-antigen ligase